jgi:hypothetical protein
MMKILNLAMIRKRITKKREAKMLINRISRKVKKKRKKRTIHISLERVIY